MNIIAAEVIRIEPKVLEPFAIYSGESIARNITIKTDGNYLVYLSWGVEGNSLNMKGFSVDYESPIQVNKEREIPITLSAAYNFFPDSFTIHLYASTEKSEEKIYKSRGSSCRPNKNFDWNCSEWNECIEGEQTRTCKKYNNCHNAYGKPEEIQNCTINEINDSNPLDVTDVDPKKISWWRKFLNWLKSIFLF